MAAIITLTELAKVARTEIEPDDEFAKWCIDSASLLVRDAGDPAWTSATAPAIVKLVAVLVAKRTYINPDGEVRTNIGPLGSSITDVEAAGMRLTDAETAQVAAAAPGVADSGTGLWIQPIETGRASGEELYLFDSSLSDWGIPYIDAADALGQIFLTPEETTP